MDIYHGSSKIVRNPVYGKGKPYNDYGLGFYCTEIPDMAREWAVRENQNGYLNHYQIDTSGLRVLNLQSDSYSILHWLTILIENRTLDTPAVLAQEACDYLRRFFSTDYKSYDVVVGYRADDSYFSFAKDFLNGTISYRQLSRAMYLGELGLQFVLRSEQSFSKIRFVSYEPVSYEIWYPKRKERDESARHAYFDAERNRRKRGDLYIMNILDEEIKPGDARLIPAPETDQ